MSILNIPVLLFQSTWQILHLENGRLTIVCTDQMTIMIESSRSFLFTEYARSICGTFKNQGTDPKVWDVLPVCLSFPLSLILWKSILMTPI